MANSKRSYEEFLEQARAAGLLDRFSEADLALAQSDPDAGFSLLGFKKDYAAAVSDEARAIANAGAEKLRRERGGYLGGADGAGYEPVSVDESYVNRLAEQTAAQPAVPVQSLSPDSYYADAAKLWGDYRKQYLREGERAYQNALGNAAANTGGIASTAAITAAQQAQNYYGAQAADRRAALYQQAYENWLAGQENARAQRQSDAAYQAAVTEAGSLVTKANQQAFDNAMAKWKAYGYVTEDIAAVLSLPVGTAYTDQAEKEWEQAYKEASSGITTGKTQYDAVNLGERQTPGDSAAAHKTVSMGANSLDVQTMQRYLLALGYSCGASGADGKFGAGTQRALINFQSASGIYPDGVCGPVTWTALIEAARA